MMGGHDTVMGSLLKYVVESYLDDYISGLGNMDCSSFPVTLRNLSLKDVKIRDDMAKTCGCPLELMSGMIGSAQLTMSWLGNIEVVANNVVLQLNFSPMKVMKKAILPNGPGEGYDDAENQVPPLHVQQCMAAVLPAMRQQQEQQQQQQHEQQHEQSRSMQQQPPLRMQHTASRTGMLPGSSAVPRYCFAHGSSEKRQKGEPRKYECASCQAQLQTSYVDACLCTVCSEKENCCLCCGADATCSRDGVSWGPGAAPAATPSPTFSGSSPRSHQQFAPVPQPSHGGSRGDHRDYDRDDDMHHQHHRDDAREALMRSATGEAADYRPMMQQSPPAMRQQQASTPPPPPAEPQLPALFCASHCTSELRQKGTPQDHECWQCRAGFRTNYSDFVFCAACSNRTMRCMLCGAPAQTPQQRAAAAERVAQQAQQAQQSHHAQQADAHRLPPPPPLPPRQQGGGCAPPYRDGSQQQQQQQQYGPPPMYHGHDHGRGGCGGGWSESGSAPPSISGHGGSGPLEGPGWEFRYH
eukprot:NODE_5514_length_1763_cov_3.072738.p1 GENE.NODE_5514_length_1763_cov_3.072738~~NODE_5514_length_1763_cov_3.072738.p1  ORF type:complete len:553 (+),score=174.08 NODE_5514_length_1763_cov_3.072738:88-1659(+)